MDIDGSGDGRLVRGEVNTLYDPSESGLTNLDDIFTGGGTTGKVVEGITKTDLRADFVITESSDFFFDETQNEIEVHDENGQVIGYIDTGNVLSESKSPEGGTGNKPSVFPMTQRTKRVIFIRWKKFRERMAPMIYRRIRMEFGRNCQ